MWWITVALIIAGILFMLVELLLVPGVGIGGFLSLLSLGAACWYSFVYIGNPVGWAVLVAVIVMTVAAVALSLRSRTWRRFELKTEMHSKVNDESRRLAVGQAGTAQTRLAPMGTGKFGEVSCEVKSHDNSLVDAGTPLEIVSIEDNQVTVKPLKEQ